MTGDRGHFPAAVGDLPGTLHCTRKIERALAFHVTRTSPKPFLAPALINNVLCYNDNFVITLIFNLYCVLCHAVFLFLSLYLSFV